MAYPGYEGYAAADPYASYHTYAPAPVYGHAGYGAPSEELRTVFITGFPNDIKERELENMLRFLPGFAACQLNTKAGQVHGFALFHDGASAANGMRMIGGVKFDDGVFLRAEMAHKNMYIREDPTAKRSRVGPGGYSGPPAYGGAPAGGSRPVGYAPINNTKDNPPCNTLFVGNLGDAVDEGELRALFGAQPGYQQLKVMRTGRNVTCFVEFDSVASATACHESQQGAMLASSDRGGMRVQFSKNPFGKKRDYHGNMVDNRDFGAQPGGGDESGGGGGYSAPAYTAPAAAGGVPGLGGGDEGQQGVVGAVDLSAYTAQGPPVYDAGVPPGIA